MKSASEGDLLVVAFLRDLRKKDIKVYAFVLAFIGIQLVLTFAKLKVTPFYLYGMFSEPAASPNQFQLRNILINNKPLSSFRAPFREKLMLNVTCDYYVNIRQNKDVDILRSRIETKYPWFTASTLYFRFGKTIYNTKQNLEEYTSWLREKSFEITGEKVSALRIVDSIYTYDPATRQLSLTRYEEPATF
jgi:hypothetical protein